MPTESTSSSRLSCDDQLGTNALMAETARPIDLGPMPVGRHMVTVDERLVRAPLPTIFELATRVEGWPAHLSHYRYVRFRNRRSDGGGVVEMSAYRPFEPFGKSR